MTARGNETFDTTISIWLSFLLPQPLLLPLSHTGRSAARSHPRGREKQRGEGGVNNKEMTQKATRGKRQSNMSQRVINRVGAVSCNCTLEGSFVRTGPANCAATSPGNGGGSAPPLGSSQMKTRAFRYPGVYGGQRHCVLCCAM